MIQVYACGYATRDKRDNQEGKVPDGTGRRFLSGGRRKCCRFWAFSLSLARRSRVRRCLGNAEEESVDLLEDAARIRALSPDMPGSTATLLFLLRHRRPERYRPPPASAATVSLAPDDLRAVEEHRRISALTPEELRAEIDEIERKRSLVAEARRNWPHGGRRRTAQPMGRNNSLMTPLPPAHPDDLPTPRSTLRSRYVRVRSGARRAGMRRTPTCKPWWTPVVATCR